MCRHARECAHYESTAASDVEDRVARARAAEVQQQAQRGFVGYRLCRGERRGLPGELIEDQVTMLIAGDHGEALEGERASSHNSRASTGTAVVDTCEYQPLANICQRLRLVHQTKARSSMLRAPRKTSASSQATIGTRCFTLSVVVSPLGHATFATPRWTLIT